MQELLNNPMVQAGIAPLLVALVVGGALWRTPLAWLAVAAAYATAVALTTGIGFTPLTAGRKVLLLVLLSPLAGLALERIGGRSGERAAAALPWIVGALAGLAAPWVFASVLAQREGAALAGSAAGLVLAVGIGTALTLRLRESGAHAGAAGVALGLAVGVAALLSASVGYLTGGVAMAAGAGALLLLQFVLARENRPGFVGTLSIGFGLHLFAAATVMLAQLPWVALPLLWLVPLAAALRLADGEAPRTRLVAAAVRAAVGAIPFVLVAWFAARAGSSVVS
ncbi:MAG: hypothetical protein U1E89_10870 [Burkholderiaceae bacterium]